MATRLSRLFPDWVRWVLVLPVTLLGGLLGTATAATIDFIRSGGGTDERLLYLITPAAWMLGSVYLGSRMTPARFRRFAPPLLAGLQGVLLIYQQSDTGIRLSTLHPDLLWYSALLAAVAAMSATYLALRVESSNL